jgi:membrane protein
MKAFLALFKTSFWEWWNDNTFRLAAALAFYTIFSMAPILLIAVEIGRLVFSEEQVQAKILEQIGSLTGR